MAASRGPHAPCGTARPIGDNRVGGEPLRPSGKLLIADKVLSVAAAAGADRFSSDPAWAETFAIAAASALQRDRVHLDVPQATIGY